MYSFKIHGKEYKVRFTYRMVCKGDLLDKVSNLDLDEMDAKGIVDKLATTTAELLLAGLQKYHSDARCINNNQNYCHYYYYFRNKSKIFVFEYYNFDNFLFLKH